MQTLKKINKYHLVLNRKISLFLIIIFILFEGDLYSQSKIDILAFIKGDSIIIISGKPPKQDEGINFYRKNPSGEFTLLNTDAPITPITNSQEIIGLFGPNWDEVSSTLLLNDPSDLVYLLSENQSNYLIMALKYPVIFKIAGCWYAYKETEKRNEIEYKIEFVDKNKSVKNTLTKKIKLVENQPLTPFGITAEVNNLNIKLRWNYPKWKRDFSDLVTQFYVYRKSPNEAFKKLNSALLLRSESDSTIFFDYEITSGVEYTYYISAVDIIGAESNPSQQITKVWYDVVPPAIPDEIKADTLDGTIGISWKMNLELDAKGYNLYRSLKHDKEFTKLNSEPLPIEKSYFYDANFEYGMQYFYRVTSVDNSGNESEKSNPLSVVYEDLIPPEPPSNFTFSLENKLLKLKWNASISSDVAGYHYYRGDSKDILPRITIEGIKNISHVDSGITNKGFIPGKKYTLAITAFDKAYNESPKIYLEDIFIPDNEPPTPPQGIITNHTNTKQVEISCGGSSSIDVSIYKLFRCEAENPESLIEIASYSIVPYVYIDTTVQLNKRYIYYTIAIDSAGNISDKSRMDTVALKDNTPPPSPRLVKASVVDGGIEITWEPVYDYDLAGYNIYKADLPNGIYIKINKEITKELRYLDNNGKTNEFYRVKAVDTGGNESTMGEYASPN
jgi:fibronectin type 3 domain-containing protein